MTEPQRRMEELRRRVALRAGAEPTSVGVGSGAAAAGDAGSDAPVVVDVAAHHSGAGTGSGSASSSTGSVLPSTVLMDQNESSAAKRRRLLEHLTAGSSSSRTRAPVDPMDVHQAGGPRVAGGRPDIAPVTAVNALADASFIIDDAKGTARKRLVAALTSPSGRTTAELAQVHAQASDHSLQPKRRRTAPPPRTTSVEDRAEAGSADTRPLPPRLHTPSDSLTARYRSPSPTPSPLSPPRAVAAGIGLFDISRGAAAVADARSAAASAGDLVNADAFPGAADAAAAHATAAVISSGMYNRDSVAAAGFDFFSMPRGAAAAAAAGDPVVLQVADPVGGDFDAREFVGPMLAQDVLTVGAAGIGQSDLVHAMDTVVQLARDPPS